MTERQKETQLSAEDQASATGAAGASADESTEPGPRSLLEAARAEAEQQRAAAEQYLNLLQRVQADFLNYKRRVEAENEARADAVRSETILAFLPIVDDLDRALSHVPADAGEQSWVQGFALIGRKLTAAFERLGLQRIGREGEPFDPNLHEAVFYEEHPSVPEGHIATVYRPGYLLGERVVRPAQVVVARAPSEAQSASNGSWSEHQGRQTHPNGDVDPADLSKPRGIERAGS